jgi:uncharacterized membrane protein YtjA (UPF0391 family)
MLARSKKNAVIMGIIFGIPVVAISFVVGTIRYAMLEPSARNPNVVHGFAGIGPTSMAVAIMLVSLGIVSLVIYQLNESHFGRQGAIRWAIAGTIYGLFQQVTLTPIPPDFDFSAVSVLKSVGGDLSIKALTLGLSYGLVFLLPALIRKRRAQ